MGNNSRKKHTAEFKGKVALAACQEKESLGELSKKYEVHPHMISNWKQALKEHCGQVFSSPGKKVDTDKDHLIEELYKQIGQLKVDNDFLKKKWQQLQEKN
ncbi:hypothetical protein AGMMS49938_05990 [Fibrobacterales bacterium]|nr:hypothetical protein AGMMS49938_05990 [Fibrobacterales bacterium]